jgi:hypothetical protein
MSKQVIYAMYNDDDHLLDAAKKLVSKGVKITNCFTPFPIHGIDPIIGIKRTRLAIVSFLFAMTGMSLALIGMNYFMIVDWPMNIGGKPSFSIIENLPAFIPVTFEFTVLLAAHGMAITYFIRNGIYPGASAKNPDVRTTDDKFLVEINMTKNSKFSTDEILNIINNETQIFELKVKE